LAEILPGVPIGRRRSGGTPLAQWAALTAAWRGRAVGGAYLWQKGKLTRLAVEGIEKQGE